MITAATAMLKIPGRAVTPLFSGRYGVRQSQKFGKNAVLGSDLYSRFASAADLEYSSGTEEEYEGWGILCFKTGLSYKDMLNIYCRCGQYS